MGLAAGSEAPEPEVRRGLQWVWHSAVTLTLVLLFVGVSSQAVTLKSLGTTELLSAPAGPRLVQWTVEHHVGEDGYFELLFRPAVLFGKFKFFWRSQIF